MTISYRLVYPAVDASPPLTAGQQAVAGHRAGVLTVLGGPRTGKTTALRHAALGAAADGAGVWFFAGSRRARLDVAAWIGRVSPPAASRVWATTFYSFSQSVLQQYASESVTVLAAARQDAYVREILAGQAPAAWPERFAPARGTPAFAASVREAIAACQREGLTPADVRARGAAEGRDDWVALAGFFEEYLDILGLAAVQDYGELLIRAGEVLRDERVLAEVRPPQTLVVVDNAEDMDPVQAGVLAVLAGPSTPLILAVDPDRQVYGFRGARLTPSAGAMVCLQRGFDVAGAVEAACGPLRQRLPLPPGTALGALDAYRHLTPDRPGEAAKVVFTDSLAEAGWVATRLRHARLTDGIAWEDMAVLVRRRSDFARYEVACEAAGVPVVVSGDEIQLGAEPIVTVLLAALRL
ncbi:MAG: UvrD-helicase domain-containing protein, partial [Propionibacteriaceae bacterium]|nr:UvrD-helicase domain-containing protein [Propionibacteriaceae bacterium]